MIRLRLLGAADVRGADGQELSAVLRQPKRLALLAYLAAAAPYRLHRRDALLALFWPELDTTHARRALRRALYFLRRAIGSGAIVTRGDDVGTPPAEVWCDVAAFRADLQADRRSDALALYEGDLLEGFFVPSAPDFERWLEEERSVLRTKATTAACLLAEEAERSNDANGVVRWAQYAAGLSGHDEVVLRGLIGMLNRVGARTKALEIYERFAHHLADDLELEPASETRALVDLVRARRPTPPAAVATAASADVIAVLPFTVRGDDTLGYLQDGMVDLLSAKLDRAGDVRTVDPHALLRYVRALAVAEVDPQTARMVAEHFGAGVFLLGTLTAAGERLHASGAIYDMIRGREVRAEVEATGEGGIFAAVDALARRLLADRTTSHGGRMARVAAVTTESLPALKAYLVGERAYRDGRYATAMTAYENAVREDPSFALGHYRLAGALAACRMPDAAWDACAKAWEHRARLNRHTESLVKAQQLWWGGDAPAAEALYDRVLSRAPDDVEAWGLLGQLTFHYNPYRGRSAMEARYPLTRAVSLDPGHAGSLVHLLQLAAHEEHREELQELSDQFLHRCHDADAELLVRVIRAAALDDRDALRQIAGQVSEVPTLAVATALGDVGLYARDPLAAEALVRPAAERARSPGRRASMHLAAAHLAMARGDCAAALAQLDRVAAVDRGAALEHRALFATFLFRDRAAEALQAARQALTAWDASAAHPSPPECPALAAHDHLHGHLRCYLLGLVCARLGDHAAALQYADECEHLAPPDGAAATPRHWARGVRALVAFLQGRAEDALAALEEITPERWWHHGAVSPFYALAAERFLRAEALIALGRHDDAAGWLEGLAQRSPYELAYRKPAGERLHAIRAGRTAR